MGQKRYYPGCASYLGALSQFLEKRYEAEGFDVQTLEEQNVRSPSRTFQMRKRYSESWIKTVSTYAGLDAAATVTMKPVTDDLEVEFGGAKWLDKAAIAGVGVLASLGVLLIPAGIGAWNQRKILKDLELAVDQFFRYRDRS